MEMKKPLIYDAATVSSIAPFLTLREMLMTATLSKEFNYFLRKYIKNYVLQSNEEGKQFAQLRAFYDRKIGIVRDSEKQQLISLPFIPTEVSLGSNYVLLKTIGNQYVITAIKTIEEGKGTLHKKIYKTFKNMFSKAVISNNFLLTFQKNIVKRYNIWGKCELVQESSYTFQHNVTDIKVSPSHIVVLCSIAEGKDQIFVLSCQTFKIKQVKFPSSGHLGQINLDHLSLGYKACYFIKNYQLYEIDLESNKEPKVFKPLSGKRIIKIVEGFQHYFAYEETQKPTNQWNTNEVVAWAEREDFTDFANIFKIQKVTGKILLNMDRKFMQQRLGILNHNIQQKMILRLKQCNQTNLNECTIHSWGRNDKGQLLSLAASSVKNPLKVKLPQNNEIYKLCSNFTFLQNIKTNTILTHTSDGKDYEQFCKHKIWDINSFKNVVIYICTPAEEKGEITYQADKKKQKTARNIVDQIKWDPNLKAEDFTIGYLTRYTGLLQMPFTQLEHSEVKEYRIQYFKEKQKIVWSKKDRINLL